MDSPSPNRNSVAPRAIATVVGTGALAGVLDGLAAIFNYMLSGGKDPGKVFQFIASGVFGKAAFAGGATTIAWGVFFHFVIAYAFTVFFFAIYPKFGLVTKNRIGVAIVYGLFVWCVMSLIVVPLSGTPKIPFRPDKAAIAAAILIVCIGLPLSLSAHRFYSRR
jgi:hypothetical protein